jgi:hypothetical protein
MAAIAKNRNSFKWPKLLYVKPEIAAILKGDHLRVMSAKFG